MLCEIHEDKESYSPTISFFTRWLSLFLFSYYYDVNPHFWEWLMRFSENPQDQNKAKIMFEPMKEGRVGLTLRNRNKGDLL